MKCVSLQEKVQGGWVRVGSGGGKIGKVRQINSKGTELLNGTSFNPERKENPFVRSSDGETFANLVFHWKKNKLQARKEEGWWR
jgi:hypothetical protein